MKPRIAWVLIVGALALGGLSACGGGDETQTVTSTSTSTTEASTSTSESAVPPDGPVDALAVLGALGSAQDDVDNAFIENGTLVLTLRGDPADIETGQIVNACQDLLDTTGALSVEAETPDRTRTKLC